MRIRPSVPVLAALVLTVVPPSVKADAWDSCRALVGNWVSVSEGNNKGTGRFSLKPDLNGQILVRKNHAELPAGQGRPAAVHDDLMIIYRPRGNQAVKAVYFDSEGHVINYTASLSKDGRTLLFVSEPSQKAPRYRLSYVQPDADTVTVRFEIAPPGKPDAFRLYLEGKVHRVTRDTEKPK